MEAVLQGRRRPHVSTGRRTQQSGKGLPDTSAAHRAAQHFAAEQAQAVRRRNMTNPVFHYTIS